MAHITDIQKYCIHDGDGIRTTVFWKGCPLKCKWCHNPETQKGRAELMDNPEKCSGCGRCIAVCPVKAIKLQDIENRKIAWTDREICTACGKCIEKCPLNIREIAGKEISVQELMKQLGKDQMFYEESGGGVTFSGGEVMSADENEVLKAARQLQELGITLTLDTCGYAAWERFEKILPYVDTFLYDLKIYDSEKHKKYTGVDNKQILENLERLYRAGAKIYLRIPIIHEVNGNKKDLTDIIKFLKEQQIQVRRIHLLPYHNTGTAKHNRLGITEEDEVLHAPSQEEMECFAELFRSAGFSETQIGG